MDSYNENKIKKFYNISLSGDDINDNNTKIEEAYQEEDVDAGYINQPLDKDDNIGILSRDGIASKEVLLSLAKKIEDCIARPSKFENDIFDDNNEIGVENADNYNQAEIKIYLLESE